MRKRGSIAVNIISRIDDDVVEKNLIKRFELWFSRGKKPKRNKWIPIIAAAASFAIVLTSAFLLWNFLKTPVYLGMTVSNEAPKVNSAMIDTDDFSPIALSADNSMLTPMYLDNTNYEGNNGNHGNEDNKDATGSATTEATTNPPPKVFDSKTYYAMPGEDIYIHVHISNPNAYEILSFTLNGVKYSSYMFEEGSDIETLILKYNVGDVEGIQEYTIEAIKYVDGEQIKDVRMKGDQTIEVMVGHDADSHLGFDISLTGFDVNIEAIWKDGFEGDKEILSLGVYDGETLIKELTPTDRVIKGLPSNSRFVLVATYKNGEEVETARYIFDTVKRSEGLQMSSGHITGIGTCQDTVLYLDAPIGENAFLDNKYITEVYLGPNVTSMDTGAFDGCTSLSSVTLSGSLEKIGGRAFRKTNLTEIEIPHGVTTIGESAFSHCINLKTVTLPDTLKTIDPYAFDLCYSLKEITLSDNLNTIGFMAFRSCKNLRNITLPDSLVIIDSYAFLGCKSLTNINIPDSVTTIEAGVFHGSGLNSIILHDGIISIRESAFQQCSELREVTLGANVRRIESDAFSHCTSLRSINIPKSVTTMGRVFGWCKQLENIVFEGTQDEWHAISKDPEWICGNNFSTIEVQCIDGTITIG